jgi:hypothetical protein
MTVTTEAKFAALTPEAIVAVEHFIAFKSGGMHRGAQLEKPPANSADINDSILLLALYTIPSDVLLELTGQIFFEFSGHNVIVTS